MNDPIVAQWQIPGCKERGTVARPVPAIFDYIDVADYLRLEGNLQQASRRVKWLRETGRLSGFRSGHRIVYSFDDVCRCVEKMRKESPA